MSTPDIDYDKLSSLVATKLRMQSVAYAQANTALEDQWLREQVLDIIANNAHAVSRAVTGSYDFEQSFKARLKSIINAIY
jgi:hypothetical protein